jgi:hypothetical protein
MLQTHGIEELPSRLHLVPPGLFLLELNTADADRVDVPEGEDPPNPANYAQTGLVFEPLDASAAWIASWLERTQAAHVATEPAPESTAEETDS